MLETETENKLEKLEKVGKRGGGRMLETEMEKRLEKVAKNVRNRKKPFPRYIFIRTAQVVIPVMQYFFPSLRTSNTPKIRWWRKKFFRPTDFAQMCLPFV